MSVRGKRGRLFRGHDPLQQLLASTDTSIVLDSDLSNPNPISAPFVFLSTLTPEHLNCSAEPTEFLLSETSNEVSVALESNGRISQGIMWQGEGYPDSLPDTQILLSSNRYENDRLGFDCETQTYHTTTTMENLLDMGSGIDQGNMNVCCVHGCESQTNDSSQTKFYTIPVDELQLRLWADSLEIDLNENVLINGLAICEKHLVSPSVLFPDKRKKNLEYESGKMERGLALSRSKRKPKPNKAYDWAQVIPFIKAEPSEENSDPEVSLSPLKGGASTVFVSGHKRKQILSFMKDKADEKGNQQPFDTQALSEVVETVEHLENISEASAPRDPPPRPKGRARKIRDSPVQTEGRGCDNSSSSRQLREVKIQCDLTMEGEDGTSNGKIRHTSCDGCSDIDWKKLETVLSACVAEIEGAPCDPMVTNCLKKFLLDVMQPSHAANVIKMLANMHKDALDIGKNIILVSSQADEEEVEIENMIHPQVEAPIDGVREIAPSESWRNPICKIKQELQPPPPPILPPQDTLSASIFDIMAGEDDPDELGLEAAAELDDEEFNPADVAEDEDEDDDDPDPDLDPEELEDDEDWDIRMGDDPPPKKRRKGIGGKSQKGMSEGEAGSRETTITFNGANPIQIFKNEGENDDDDDEDEDEGLATGLGRRRRIPGDKRWVRQMHKCPECDESFSTQRKFDVHFNYKHMGIAPWKGEHVCEDCGKVFTQKVSLRVHRMFKHGAPKRYKCAKCEYVGPTKEYLKRHSKVHTNHCQYVCPTCGKGLKTAETFRNHMVIHTNEGRFLCDICNKAFNHKGAYEDHRRIHQDERDFACRYCGATFKAYKHVARHIRAVHLNDKRFVCDICGSQFMTSFNLKGHLKKHGEISHLEYTHECISCEAKFRGTEGLAAHLRVVHQIDDLEDTIIDSSSTINSVKPPHPTRRPVKYHYTRVSDDSDQFGGAMNAIYVEGDNYIVLEPKVEDVVYEVFSDNNSLTPAVEQEDSGVVESVTNTDEGGGEKIIHVYSCINCNAMFTSQNALEIHQTHCVPVMD
ncbi:unnamed protein product [Meganyctiphanes norvegica]|uniref:C2H2-type domain-containing protein n=1 Tax=Meganyctiphanes norvegica TaxID=48144 RepID=A0AAV2PNC7_MEGNR